MNLCFVEFLNEPVGGSINCLAHVLQVFNPADQIWKPGCDFIV